jgi:hypothetical protein
MRQAALSIDLADDFMSGGNVADVNENCARRWASDGCLPSATTRHFYILRNISAP